MEIGDRIRADANHWLRPNAVGKISDFDGSVGRGVNRWLIQFDVAFSGGGIGDDKIWLNESQFVVEGEEKRKGRF